MSFAFRLVVDTAAESNMGKSVLEKRVIVY